MIGEPSGDISDLIGSTDGGGASADNTSTSQGALDAVNTGIRTAGNKDDKEREDEAEKKIVKHLWHEYAVAREFDRFWRVTIAQDRRYAGGRSDPSWASDANLIGSFIDILVSFLYAQNPDVSAKAAERVGSTIDKDAASFAETAELVVSKLWKRANGQPDGLKRAARRQVRACLSTGEGWAKGLMWSRQRPQPQVEKELHTMEAQMQRLEAAITEAREDASADHDLAQKTIGLLMQGLRKKLELSKEVGLNYDHVRSEDIQISLDVSSTEDYLSAEWISEDLYIVKDSLRARFPRLEEDDAKSAVAYYAKQTSSNAKGEILQAATGEEVQDGAYSKTAPGTTPEGGKAVEFVKVVELWDRRDGTIKTMCDGVDRWCEEPFLPPQASNRFYPYFRLAFFEVDGDRHPQSLPTRLRKLQDEYNACRSNQRLTRERSIPGLIFNAGLLDREDAKKLEVSVIAEMVGIKPTEIGTPIQNIVMVKPLPTIDVRLWDTQAILSDMERLSGVQEAMQQAMSQQPKTATEAQIQQTGFASRTAADRDAIEMMLDDLAQYCLETGIQEIPSEMAQRIAGPQAFWPTGMDVQDILTMVSIEVNAGTTGKPNLAADKANWSTILPLLQKLMIQIRQVQPTDPPLAECLKNLLRESLHRMDDRLDIDEFIAVEPPPPPAGPPPPPPPSVTIALKGVLPPEDAVAIGAKAAGIPPMGAPGGPGSPGGPPQHPIMPGHPPAEGELPPHPVLEPLPAATPPPHAGGIKAM